MIFAFSEREEAKSVREAAKAVREAAEAVGGERGQAGHQPRTAVEAQAGLVDFGSLAQLATALAKLKVSAIFLVMGLALIALAAAAATAGVAVT